MKRTLAYILAAVTLLFALPVRAEILQPVKWSWNVNMTSADEGEIVFSAKIDNGWHMYSTDVPAGGPQATQFLFSEVSGAELTGGVVPSRKATVQLDKMFDLNIGFWDADVTFTQKFHLLPGSGGCVFSGAIVAMACNNSTCTPPDKTAFNVSYNASTAVGHDTASVVQSTSESNGTHDHNVVIDDTSENPGWWAPSEMAAEHHAGGDWWYIALWGFLGGLLALLTPCVWPMIPLTVSFFLKKSASRKRAVGDAVIYGLSIVVIYLVLGLAVTMIFDAGKLNELATNAVFNLTFFALLLVFAISFFGAFDIKLPAKWSNKMDSKAERTSGLISIFFMAFTLALVSFSCTGPLIGTLLVEAAVNGEIAGPAIGMGAFALALAIPFTLFALFPSMLKELPRSGGWLNSVKVVLGFLELALSLKFLSVADLAYGWGLLDREIFIALWIVIFVLLGMYLLGKLQFSHDAPLQHVSLPRFFLALASLSFAVYLIPGLWGAPLKGVSAFTPPLNTQDFNLYQNELTHFDNYNEGMSYAAAHDKPVLLDFSGYGCVNCRKMEGAVFDTPDVIEAINDNFVMITLMVDDKRELPQPEIVMENGKEKVLTTVGDKWSYLQRVKFNTNSQPFYVILNNDGTPMEGSRAYNENVAEFLQWLETGLSNYRSQQK